MAITLDGSNGITTDIASNESATFNRDTTDGDIIILQKDNATVGSIGTKSDRLFIGDDSFGGLAFSNGVSTVFPADSSGSPSDNTHDLGTSSNRFKDLYLSGGVYLGGTTSTNYLDDYEEGEFSGALTLGSGTVTLAASSDTLEYTKIGRVVTITGLLRVDSVSSPSGSVSISLPFAVSSVVGSGVENTARSFVGFNVSNNLNVNNFVLVAAENESNLNIFNASGTSLSTSNVGESFKSNSTIAINFSYRVA